jgi:hypothetical protein
MTSARIAFLILCGFASAGFAQAPAVPVRPPDAPDLTKPIADVLAGKIDRTRFRLDVTWFGERGGRAAVVHGNGSGILNRKQQFQLKPEQVNDILILLDRAKFGSMKTSFGGIPFKGPGPRPGRPERLLGGVTVTIDGKTRGSSQMGDGEQSKELAELADALLKLCELAAARQSVTAASLADGLKKIGTGELLPESFSVLVHRLIEKPMANAEGFLFRVEGNVVLTRTNRPGVGYGPVHRFELSREQLAELTKKLADADPASFPVNLWAVTYTDFRVGVLNFEKDLQARQFAGMTPQKHGEKQKRFDALYGYLEQLHQKALKEGKPQKDEQQ